MKAVIALMLGALLLPAALAHAQATAPQAGKPVVDVVFCLDSTGSMGGLIEGAKQKIWSIANSVIAQEPSPRVRIGLLAYRDRGDEYVTRKFDLTDDIDTVFRNLMSFQAGGGADTPESVNQALSEAVRDMSWTRERDALRIVFLVGDAPPHMDYQDDVKYHETCRVAARANIIINTIQCGGMSETVPFWTEIARLAEGEYVKLEQSGGMVAVSTPFDEEIAEISRRLGETVTPYGSKAVQREVAGKNLLAAAAPAAVAADRADFNYRSGGRAVQGRGDLVTDIAEGAVKLEDVKAEDLPEELKRMTETERKAHIEAQQKKRAALNTRLAELARRRAGFIEQENKRLAAEGKGDAFDQKVNEIVSGQFRKR